MKRWQLVNICFLVTSLKAGRLNPQMFLYYSHCLQCIAAINKLFLFFPLIKSFFEFCF
uniref:Uncharacterized protein n=1 Tax=Octopus bimaculoides TaxID=37653 RepID=A0A0L8G4J8_OCTBM